MTFNLFPALVSSYSFKVFVSKFDYCKFANQNALLIVAPFNCLPVHKQVNFFLGRKLCLLIKNRIIEVRITHAHGVFDEKVVKSVDALRFRDMHMSI